VIKTTAANNPVRVVPVNVRLPIGFYKQLKVAADERETTVGEMVAALAQIGAKRKPVNRRDARSSYTFEIGREMLKMKELNRSNEELARSFGVSTSTARIWLIRAEDEFRMMLKRKAA